MSASVRAVRRLVERIKVMVREEIDLDCHCASCRKAIDSDWDEIEDALIEAVLALVEER